MTLSSQSVIYIFCLYMGLLFLIALVAQKYGDTGRSLVNNPLAYSLSLAVYCSSWTFFGGVGLAANKGTLFLAIYLGPTLVLLLGGGLWRRMIRINARHRITSIADFISTRYDKSEKLAAAVTIVLLVGSVPYVALQLKAVLDAFAVLAHAEGGADSYVGSHAVTVVVGLMILFTIIFGVRRLEPTERHQGMVMAVAVESLVKLICCVAAGVFVSYWIFDGVGDIFDQASTRFLAGYTRQNQAGSSSFALWFTYLVVSANAIICLPRQFHITVVENMKESHIRWAMWLFPLYLFVINLFIYPVGLGGILSGLPADQADTFLLQLPLLHDNHLLAMLVFIGGFSAATSMILISSMTMATMISNHLLLPLVDWFPQLVFIERRLLQCRWLAVAAYILMGYYFERLVGGQFRLADMGLISFVAVLQLAPALLGGLFWRGGTRLGAMMGLLGGFAVWTYTLLLPTFIKAGWLAPELLTEGPLGLVMLRPHALFGLSGLDPVTHTVFWSLFFNVSFYILGSLWDEPSQESQSQAEAFVGVISNRSMFSGADRRQANITVSDKRRIIIDLFSRYFGRDKAVELTDKALKESGVTGRRLASITDVAELYEQVEKTLGASIGSATANRALARAEFFTPAEAEELREMYAELLANLRARPRDLKRKIDFYREREALINRHAEELEEKVRELEHQITGRQTAEERLRESEERYRLAIEGSSDGVVVINDGQILWCNGQMAEIFGYTNRREIVGRPVRILVHPEEQEHIEEIMERRQAGQPVPSRYDFKGVKKDGTELFVAVSATTINYHNQTMNMAYMRDVTRRRMAEEEIRELSRRLIVGLEEDRRRLAADLHDEFGQALTGLHMGVENLLNALPQEQTWLKADGDRLISLIEQLAENLRNLCSELRPDMLDHLGLAPTAQWYIEDFMSRVKGVRVDFQAAGFKGRKLDPEVDIVLYRILQEALNNVAKHAQAENVTVRLTYSHPKVIMIISDDGLGFDQNQILPTMTFTKKGIGLVSMKERTASAGGEIDIRSAPGQGTTIRVSLPTFREPKPARLMAVTVR